MNKFQVIVADPPWGAFKDKLSMSDVKRGAEANYSTLSTEELKLLPVKNVADSNGCILVLWVPSSLLEDGLEVMKAWGFTQKQTYIWVKNKKEPFNDFFDSIKKLPILKQKTISKQTILETFKEVKKEYSLQLNNFLQFGMGRLFRASHEIALIGTNNNGIYKLLENRSQRSVCFFPNLKHSAKPEHLQNSLEIMFPTANYMEMFARRVRPNWLCLGNEIGSKEDIRVSLNNLINI